MFLVCFVLFYFLPHLELTVCCCHNWYISGSNFEENWQKINRWAGSVVWPGLSTSEFCYRAKHFYSLCLMSEHMQRWTVKCTFSGWLGSPLRRIKKKTEPLSPSPSWCFENENDKIGLQNCMLISQRLVSQKSLTNEQILDYLTFLTLKTT